MEEEKRFTSLCSIVDKKKEEAGQIYKKGIYDDAIKQYNLAATLIACETDKFKVKDIKDLLI